MSKQTEKNIFIGIGVSVLIGVGILFLGLAEWSTADLKASITTTNADGTVNDTSTSNDDTDTIHAVKIEKGYLLGGNTLYRNGIAKLSLGLSSEESINTTQSIEVEMIEGNINIQNYDESFARTRYILEEFIHENNVSKIMENNGEKNWAAVYIDLNIPDYGNTQMPDGEYTLVASIHRDESHKSEVFIPVQLKSTRLSCDINDDGFENMIDIILSLKIMNGEITPSAAEKEKLDSNNNGFLDLVDTMTVFKCILDPKSDPEGYFKNYCKNSTDPIDILLCPAGTAPYIRHIEIDESTDEEGNTVEQTNTTYAPDPLMKLFE